MDKVFLKKGFTLLELLIVIAIIAILAVIIFLVISPSELLKKSRDSQRMSDLATLKTALSFYKINTLTPNMAGGNNSGCRGTANDSNWQTSDYIYYSYPSDTSGALITDKNLDGVTFLTGGAHQVTNNNLSFVNGLGWLPVNFLNLSSGSPISNLPIDPVNSIVDLNNITSTDLVYRYTCLEQTLKYEINATLESQAYTVMDNKMAKDGGNNNNYYEVGTDLNIFDSEDSGCIADCINKNCGDDGCGGFCGNCSGNQLCSLGTCQEPAFVCGQNFTDSRDSQIYSTISINGQCWLAENMAYLPSVSPSNMGATNTPYYYVYGYQGVDTATAKLNSNYDTYGVLYNYLASLLACPASWHLPNDTEWTSLTNYVGGTAIAGSSLKASITNIVPWDGLNTFNFTILPSGRRHTTGSFFTLGTNSYFWSSTSGGVGTWTRGFASSVSSVSRAINPNDYGYPIRCIKD